jgi:uncharacterized protein
VTTAAGRRRHILDTHVHVFPDKVAAAALPGLAERAGMEPRFDGTLRGLLAAMERTGVARSVVQPVATRPQSVAAVNDWAASLKSGRVLSFGAMHPDHPDPGAEIARLAALGLRGFKLHPEFQVFHPDDDRMAPIYEAALAHGLVVFFHAGADIAIPTVHSTPRSFARVLDTYPALTVVLAHMGGWKQWDEVLEVLAGRDVYLETSFTLPYVGAQAFRDLVAAHGAARVVFGSDGPWADAADAAAGIAGLGLPAADLEAILWGNGAELLGLGEPD